MEYIQRLPFILSTTISIIIGMVSFGFNAERHEIYIRMAICIVVFFIIGIYIRSILLRIIDEIELKKQQNEIAAQEEHENKVDQKVKEKLESMGLQGDYKIEHKDLEQSEEFEPLKVSEILSKTIK